jgi:hypothetical protein
MLWVFVVVVHLFFPVNKQNPCEQAIQAFEWQWIDPSHMLGVRLKEA